MLVLVLEDDPDYAEIIAHTLKRDGHEVVTFDSANAAVRFCERKPPDFAVLDVLLPDGSGLEVCPRLREIVPSLPVVFLSSLDRTEDVLGGFNSGADDYLTKPFHPGELLARVRAVTRRADPAHLPPPRESQRIVSNGLELDLAGRSACFEGVSLNCTPLEVEILAQLVRYPGQALSHGYLTEQVWGYKNVKDATLLKGHVSSIRRKIRDAGGHEDMVRTVHGVGYSFTPV
jgi:DNA-binding response OmpR family regulator